MKAAFSYSRRKLFILLVIAALFFASWGYWKWQQTLRADQVKSQYTTLDARVVWTSDVFRIINLDSRTWLNCQFLLNRSDNQPGYIFFRDRVQPREVLQIAHKLFIDPAGQPYVYKKDQPNSFSIRCEDVNNEVGLFSGRYSQ
jgi:hypothetical protein